MKSSVRRFKSRERPLRFFIGFTETAGYYKSLATGLEKSGHSVRFVAIKDHPFDYGLTETDRIGRLIRKWGRMARRLETDPRWSRLPVILQKAAGVGIMTFSALFHDVFIFANGVTFADLAGTKRMWPLKLFRRKVVVIFNGSDSRPYYCSSFGRISRTGKPVTAKQLERLNNSVKRTVQRSHELADVVIDNPTRAHFHPGPFVNRIKMGIAMPSIKKPEIKTPGERSSGWVPVVLHCPSSTTMKGSAEIRKVIEEMQETGTQIDFVELNGVPNSQVIEAIQRCDFVIDQLYSDSPMAAFAAEAATYGKPALVGGYSESFHRKLLSEDEYPPTICFAPHEFANCLAEFLELGPEHWRELGAKAQEFLYRQWSEKACAENLIRVLHSAEPSESPWVSPDQCDYLWGCGLHAIETLELAQIVMKTTGPEGFGLDGKPELLAKLVALGSLNLMEQDTPPAEFPELADLENGEWKVASRLVERVVDLQTQYVEHQRDSDAKLENFRGMIERRDRKIEKLEQKLSKLNQTGK